MSLSTTDPATKQQSLTDYVFQRLSAISGGVALIDDVESSRVESIPGDLILLRSVRVADCLRAGGSKAGDVIAVFCESRPEIVWLTLGALMAGVAVAFIDCDLDDRELRHALNASRPSMVYASGRTSSRMRRLAKGCPTVPRIVIFGDEFLGRSVMLSFNVIVRNARIPFRRSDANACCDLQQPTERPAFIGFGCDRIGRFKSVTATHLDVLARLKDGSPNPSRRLSRMASWVELEDIIANLCTILGTTNLAKL